MLSRMRLLQSRHSGATLIAFFVGAVFREVYGLLRIVDSCLWRLFFFISPKYIFREAKSASYDCEQLENGRHARLLSTSMPNPRKMKPTRRIARTILHLGLFGSKSSYRGAKTIMRVPASRNASEPISATGFLFDKITSVHGEEACITLSDHAAASSLYSRFSDFISFNKVLCHRA